MFSINQISKAIYATYLTNKIGLKVRNATTNAEKKKFRIDYAETLLSKLNIKLSFTGAEKIKNNSQYLIVSNHRSVIDPLIVEMALKETDVFGYWIAKKELYNSFFFGAFVRNLGSIQLDRDAKQMSSLFSEIKTNVSNGDSICIFPEGTRNKSNNTLGEFKKGSSIIARKSNLDVLPIYIKTNANDVLMASLTENAKDLVIDVEIGDVIPYDKKSKSLEESYKAMFGIT